MFSGKFQGKGLKVLKVYMRAFLLSYVSEKNIGCLYYLSARFHLVLLYSHGNFVLNCDQGLVWAK